MNRPSSLTEKTAASEPAARNSCLPIGSIPNTRIRRRPPSVSRYTARTMPCGLDLGQLRRLAASPRVLYRAAKFSPFRRAKRNQTDEARYPPRLPHHQGGDDRRQRIHHPLHLGQGRRCHASRHRPEVAPGLDRRPAAIGRSRRPAVALPEEVLGLLEGGREEVSLAL